jgi:hypothetical protein
MSAPNTSKLRFRTAAEICRDTGVIAWLLQPFLEQNSSAIMFGELGTFKSILAIDWGLQVATGATEIGGKKADPRPVIYLSAEGRGLSKRIRGWAKRHLGGVEALAGVPFLAIERPVNLSSGDAVKEIVSAMADTGMTPALIIIDTLSRNSDGRVEGSTDDATQYLNTIDSELRARFGACVLFVHHVGHLERHRARGPYVFMANTDANFLVERPDRAKRLIRITTGRLKDSESPAPVHLEGAVVELDEVDEAGNPVTTLVLEPTGRATKDPIRRPGGKQQLSLLEAIESRQRPLGADSVISSDEIKDVCESLRLHRNTTREATSALVKSGLLVATAGGYRLGDGK